MPRALFEKTGDAIFISHLDLMRLFQRAFKRAGLKLTHSQGFNPRPSVSIALPLSVGVESECELLDFDLYGEAIPMEDIKEKLNAALVAGVRVKEVYDDGSKIKHLSYLRCTVTLEYDAGVKPGTADALRTLFGRESLILEKKGKNGVTEQDIIPMIRQMEITEGEGAITLEAVICCQNPTLNPAQLVAAVEHYAPEYTPDFAKVRRLALYDQDFNEFK